MTDLPPAAQRVQDAADALGLGISVRIMEQATRTAKEAAAEITNPIAGDIFPPAPEPARPEGQVMVLEGMTIRGDVKP